MLQPISAYTKVHRGLWSLMICNESASLSDHVSYNTFKHTLVPKEMFLFFDYSDIYQISDKIFFFYI